MSIINRLVIKLAFRSSGLQSIYLYCNVLLKLDIAQSLNYLSELSKVYNKKPPRDACHFVLFEKRLFPEVLCRNEYSSNVALFYSFVHHVNWTEISSPLRNCLVISLKASSRRGNMTWRCIYKLCCTLSHRKCQIVLQRFSTLTNM